MRLLILLTLLFFQSILFGQNLKISHFTFSAGKSYIRDPYKSFDYYLGYANDLNSLQSDSMQPIQFSNLVSNSLHQTVWYTDKKISLHIGLQPKNENRELNVGIHYSKAEQSSYRGYAYDYLPWDTLSIENNSGDVDTFYSTLIVTDDRTFGLNTKNLFISFDYLFKTKSSCLTYYAGIGLNLGLSLKNTMYSRGMPVISETLYNPASGQHYSSSEVESYPTWFFDQPQWQQGENYYISKQIFYFTPYIPFGILLPLSQAENVLSRFSIDIRACVGIEIQMMKRNTLMIRQFLNGNLGLKYTI